MKSRSIILLVSIAFLPLCLSACGNNNRGEETTLPAGADPSTLNYVVCAQRNISAGEVLKSTDLIERQAPVRTVPQNAAHQLEEALGHEAKRSLAEGQIVTQDDIGRVKNQTDKTDSDMVPETDNQEDP